jgi:hypothetical protein
MCLLQEVDRKNSESKKQDGNSNGRNNSQLPQECLLKVWQGNRWSKSFWKYSQIPYTLILADKEFYLDMIKSLELKTNINI